MASGTVRVKKEKHIRQRRINPCASWRHTEVFWSKTISLCKKLNFIYNIITCNQSLRPTLQSDVRFVNESFFWTDSFSELNKPVHQIVLNRLKQFTTRAAQIYKLLNQNSPSDQNISVYDPIMLVLGTHSGLQIWLCSDMHTWTKHLNEGAKL